MNIPNDPQQIFMLTLENLRCIMQECFALAIKNKQDQESEKLLSTADVMARCKVDRTTLYRWRLSEYLVPIKVGKKKNFYKLSDIERLGM